MLKFSWVLLFTSILVCDCFGQTALTWTKYGLKEPKVSVLLPHLPVVTSEGNDSIDETTERFGTYHNGVIYVIGYTRKVKDNYLKRIGQPYAPFGLSNLKSRLAKFNQVFNKSDLDAGTKSASKNWQTIKFSVAETDYQFYVNLKDSSWIELWAVNPAEDGKEAAKFFASFEPTTEPSDKEIGKGANSAIGDMFFKPFERLAPNPNIDVTAGTGNAVVSAVASGNGIGSSKKTDSTGNLEDKVETKKVEIKKLTIILKPRANYTEEARRNQVTGTVRLKVTFSSAGYVSSVSAASGLPYGLTEQAVEAVRKIVFLPEKRNGERIFVSKTVEYNFNLY